MLTSAIRRWGIDSHAAQDLSQDVAERAWRRRVEFEGDGDLLRWCRVVARNLIVDRYRRSGREVLDAADAGSSESAEDVAVSRLEAERLVAAFSRLPAPEQQAIVGSTAMPATSAERVRRHRARARFAQRIAAIGAAAGMLGRAVRRWRAPLTAAATAAPALIALVVLAGGVTSPDSDSSSESSMAAAEPLLTATDIDAARATTGDAVAAAAVDTPRPAPPRDVVPWPERRIEVPLPGNDPGAVDTHDRDGDRPTYCMSYRPLAIEYCTPL